MTQIAPLCKISMMKTKNTGRECVCVCIISWMDAIEIFVNFVFAYERDERSDVNLFV